MNRAVIAFLAIVVAVPVVGLACDDKKPSSDSARADASAGSDKYATADPKLTKAIMAATSASAASDNGPPPAGIFAPGGADRRHPKGAPTKVEMVTDGADPKVSFAATPDAGTDPRASSYGPAVMELAQQMGRGVAMPTIDFGMNIGPGKKDEGGPDWLVVDVVSATPAHEQMGQLPPGMDKAIATLAGSQIRIKLTPLGMESDMATTLGKTSKPELDRLAFNAAEALVFATVPSPGKPVGVGAQWIAETRMVLSGLDVVAYRAYRVKSIDGDRCHVELDVKAYAADKDVQLAGLPQGATLEQFDLASQGEQEFVRGETLARKSDVQQRVVMVFSPPGGADKSAPGQPPNQANMLSAQLASQATFVRGSDLRQALKQ
jgi:hypothetical protein